ncbi:hypothetical protein AC249_AIPGENE20196 [Exaiptasia diaphana]|nr:hypothetical protein AC249_AIPGENE20196 [Exaiptasia diaphana]
MITDLGNGWRRYGDAAIKLFSEKKNWTDARHHCQSLGADLLSITSSHENNFVNEVFVKQLNLSYFREDYPDFGTPSEVWKLNQSVPTVKLFGPPDNVLYKAVNGETALYFSEKNMNICKGNSMFCSGIWDT